MDSMSISSITPASLRRWPHRSVAVVAHDAGSSHHLYSWLNSINDPLRFCLRGPALDIFRHYPFPLNNIRSIDNCIRDAKLLISGTSWQSDHEFESRCLAKELGIPVVAVLDHWVNFPQRFCRYGNYVLPDLLWVSDIEALKIASFHFPDVPIIKLENQWLSSIIDYVMHLRSLSNKLEPSVPANRLLYILEPLRDLSTGSPTFAEFSVLNYFIQNLERMSNLGIINSPSTISLSLRLHPSEPVDKYNQWISDNQTNISISIDSCSSLAESLALSDVVFGCETQALVVSATCGIPTFSTLHPSIGICRLPHSSIRSLAQLLDFS